MKKTLLSILALFAFMLSYSQEEIQTDKVLLNDGHVMLGKVVKQDDSVISFIRAVSCQRE
jgi:hypothetical protein